MVYVYLLYIGMDDGYWINNPWLLQNCVVFASLVRWTNIANKFWVRCLTYTT